MNDIDGLVWFGIQEGVCVCVCVCVCIWRALYVCIYIAQFIFSKHCDSSLIDFKEMSESREVRVYVGSFPSSLFFPGTEGGDGCPGIRGRTSMFCF